MGEAHERATLMDKPKSDLVDLILRYEAEVERLRDAEDALYEALGLLREYRASHEEGYHVYCKDTKSAVGDQRCSWCKQVDALLAKHGDSESVCGVCGDPACPREHGKEVIEKLDEIRRLEDRA